MRPVRKVRKEAAAAAEGDTVKHEWGTKALSRDSAFVLCERLFFAVIVYAAAGLALFQKTDNCAPGCLLLYIGV